MIFIDHVDLIFIYWKNWYHLMLKCGGMLFPIFLVLTVFSMWFNRSLCVVLSILVSLDLDNPKIESLDQFLTQLFKVCDFSFRISDNLGHNIVATGLNVWFAWKLWYTSFQKKNKWTDNQVQTTLPPPSIFWTFKIISNKTYNT